MPNTEPTRKPELGQVWTPRWVVERILDEVNYQVGNPDLSSMVVMEPSFGSGAFLYPILDRLIEHCRGRGFDAGQIRDVIERCVHGIEYDAALYRHTLVELNLYLAEAGIAAPKWQLHRGDALTYEPAVTYDAVVGNPPYIRVHDMDADMRAAMTRFSLTGGTTDLYVAFFELGLGWLRPGGLLGYITPNSFLRNTSQRTFRKHLIEAGVLRQVEDFGARKIFDGAATYAAITLLGKPVVPLMELQYVGYRGDHAYTVRVPYATLRATAGETLVFGNEEERDFLHMVATRTQPLSSLLRVQYGVATLRDKLYVSAPDDVEADLLRPVVKAPIHKGGQVTGRILFPYRYEQGRVQLIPERELTEKFPKGYAYLLKNRDELEKRDRDKGSPWYAYGRSQGLAQLNQPKLVVSHLIAPGQTRLQVHKLDAATVVYSGLFITAIPGGPSLDELRHLLQQPDVCRFLTVHGKDMAGGYKSFTAKTIIRYRVD